ncbi:hypothetical protein Tco_0938482 [Tanacetum coccineum]|uniref:Reverse transcriptase domain-containing protein n=1 Tax=Tanacetum coccineum TaxID=301880 RepID=A0ABQ5DI65_9ASTR
MLRKMFLGNYSQQKKYIKDPVEIHHIKQREGESKEAFMERFKAESMHVSGAPECMKILGFIHGITNPDLIKKLNDNIPKSVDEMMSVTTAFLRGEVAAANQLKKKAPPAWKHHEASHRPNFDKGLDFKSQHKSNRRQDRFTPLTKTPNPYNGIIGRPGLRKIQAVPSTAHVMLKFSVKGGIATIRNTIIMPTECRMVTEAQDAFQPREPTVTEGIKAAIHLEYPEQTITIDESLSEKERMELCNLLKENLDIFSWRPTDMTDIPRFIATSLEHPRGVPTHKEKKKGAGTG